MRYIPVFCCVLALFAVAFGGGRALWAAEAKTDNGPALPVLPSSKPYVQPYVGAMSHYKTSYEDTLVKIARAHDLGFNELRSANPTIDPWLPGDGGDLVLPGRHLLPDAPRDGIVINLPEMRLYYFYQPDQPPITHPLGVGREGLSTPSGETQVIRKTEGPSWRPTARMREEDPSLPAVVPAGPENPLGTHALYLGWPEYALHGTNKPYGIGRRVSSGCIRLYPEDIATFYDKVPVGTKVRVVNQPIKLAWIKDELYLEAHPSLDQADKIEQEGGLPSYELAEDDLKAIGKAAGEDYALLDWDAIRQAIYERSGIPVVVAVRPRVAERTYKAGNQAESNRPEHVTADDDAQDMSEDSPVSQTPKPKQSGAADLNS